MLQIYTILLHFYTSLIFSHLKINNMYIPNQTQLRHNNLHPYHIIIKFAKTFLHHETPLTFYFFTHSSPCLRSLFCLDT